MKPSGETCAASNGLCPGAGNPATTRFTKAGQTPNFDFDFDFDFHFDFHFHFHFDFDYDYDYDYD